MTKLTYYTATTLDGFIADAEDSLDWLFVQDHDQRGLLNYDDFYADIGAVVMGSTTYTWITDRNRRTGEQWAYAIPAWVMTSRQLPTLDEADLHFASGPVQPVYDAMVAGAGGKDLWVVGGGDLAGQFADAGLLDEVITYTAPVTLGSGRPLLPRRLALKPIESGLNGAFVCTRYQVSGPGAW